MAIRRRSRSPWSRPSAEGRAGTGQSSSVGDCWGSADSRPSDRIQNEEAVIMKKLAIALTASLALMAAGSAFGADDSKVKDATGQVESGAKKIGKGVGEGVEETAKGIGHTVSEGAKYTGDKLKESGQAAEPATKSAWDKVKGGASDFGHGVKNFFTRLFNG